MTCSLPYCSTLAVTQLQGADNKPLPFCAACAEKYQALGYRPVDESAAA